jgi:aryl-alcohol dehydrogenase-like predicted oxidoreductase
MQYGYMGASNLRVSKICLGTMHFGGVTPEAESHAIMDKALEMGINFFDTANVYGGPAGTGATETVIGNWFAQGGGRRDQVVLASKTYNAMNRPAIPSDPNDDRGVSVYKVRRDIAASLKRLQTDHLDLYQVHHIDRRVRPEEFWGAFGKLLDDGDVLYMGTSNFPGWGLTKFQNFARQQGRLGLISEQTQYNLLNRYPELEVIPAAEDSGIGLFPYMPLAGGLLTGQKKAVEGSRTRAVELEYGLDLGSEQFAAWSTLCAEIGEPEFVVAIAWVLANPVVSSAIVGVRTLRHLDGLEQAAELKLDADVMARLDEIFDINLQRPLKMAPAPEAFAW